MAIQFKLSDFRRLFELRYPYPDSLGLMFNWHYAVPFDLGFTHRPDPPAEFRFLLHLRMHRRIHAYSGIEEMIIRSVAKTFQGSEISAEVNAGLGWSDVFVNGHLPAKRLEEFIRLLLITDNMHMDVEGVPEPVFSRVFSILGYPWANNPEVSHGSHLTLLRVAPGSIPTVHPRLLPLKGDIRLVEGKSDLAVMSPEGPSDFLHLQRNLAEDPRLRNYIQKVETHLVFSSVPSEGTSRGEPLKRFAKKKHLLKCSCEQDHREVRLEADIKMPWLPIELRHAVQNMMLLLSSAVRDDTMCCDVRNPVVACERSLVRLLNRLEPASQKSQSRSPDALTPPDFDGANTKREERINARLRREQDIHAAYRGVTDWHMWAERILKQRTVGSFDELFGQSDRAITYNGGVQKFLFLADALIDDFVRRIDRVPAERPTFATLYDSVQTILSVRGLGFIRIPALRIFQLPLAVSDLWHEVGVYLFYLRYGDNFADLPADAPATFGTVERLADHYGDLIVYLYGFGGDWKRAIASLIIGGVEAHQRDRDQEVRASALFDTLWRAYVLTEFDELRSRRPNLNFEGMRNNAISRIREFVESLRAQSDLDARVGVEAWVDLAIRAATPEIDTVRELAFDLVAVGTRRKPVPAKLDNFTKGDAVPFERNEDINETYARFADLIRSKDCPPEATVFRMMAALGKSATSEYHRRQVEVGADPRLRGRVRVK
ncbi:MAG: hypothetical protein QOK37_4648 [Thermoanaerobaculia bacterium]|nr:hypothetical protein [Thermoanaerobaculia bacterium]